MARNSRAVTAIIASLALLYYAGPALAQKPGGILRMYHFDSPASISLHEEVTYAALGMAMGLFNNLIMFNQHVRLHLVRAPKLIAASP